jgi:hypothetical protein
MSAKLCTGGLAMADLRITGVSTSHLELEAPDGSKHSLEITEDLLKALKARKPTDAGKALTPREIQEQIRHGKTIEQLLVENPADEDAIRKYGAPIISELTHVVNLARNVRLNLATDRFADPAHIEFGLVMDDRLATNRARILNWTSKKSTDGQWLVQVNYELNGSSASAIWSFNAKLLLLTPENQSAIQLSNGMPLTGSSSQESTNQPKAEPTPATAFVHPVIESTPLVEAPSPLSVVPEISESAPTEVIEVQEDTSSRPILRVLPEEPETIFESSYLDEPLDEEPAEVFEEAPQDETVIEEIEPVVGSTPVVEETVENPAASEAEPAKPQTTSRWAEVLFGTKEEDEETF